MTKLFQNDGPLRGSWSSKISGSFLCLALSYIVIASTHAEVCDSKLPDGTCTAANMMASSLSASIPKKPFGSSPTTSRKTVSSPCNLYLAESTIAEGGWGLFTGTDLEEDDQIDPMDVAIQVVDYEKHHKYAAEYGEESIPSVWPLAWFLWKSRITRASLEAASVHSALPGLGMLASNFPGLTNIDVEGSLNALPTRRKLPHAGAYSHYQEFTYSTNQDLPAGHELFVPNGDEFFDPGARTDPNEPTTKDYEKIDLLLQEWESDMSGDLDTNEAIESWESIVAAAKSTMKPSAFELLPKSAAEAAVLVSSSDTLAMAKVPTSLIRSIDWLQEHGICLDNFKVKKVKEEVGSGAISSRRFRKGEIVAPTPVLPMSREHLKMYLLDESEHLAWQGYQLLLNYCYGHPSSSVLLFPLAPGVNLINHSLKPNIALRWSVAMPRPELLDMSAQHLLFVENSTTPALMMEFYALRDINVDEPLLLNYGTAWQDAWDRHMQREWFKPVHADDYVSAWYYDQNDEIYPITNREQYPPSWVQVRCWIQRSVLDPPEEDKDPGWYSWNPAKEMGDYMDETEPCSVLSVDSLKSGTVKRYRIELMKDNLKVKNVPWNAITFAEEPYTGNQYLRQSFRHEIQLPDEMVPDAWRDIEQREDKNLNRKDESGQDTCGLYLAESAIPNSGLGMYSAWPISKGDTIFNDDVVIQVEDFELNMKMRHWHNNELEFEEPYWLLEHYYWNSAVTWGYFEAPTVESAVPGLGMLANSHMGLVNAEVGRPTKTQDLHRGKDPGAGVSSDYHHMYYTASRDIQVGEEIFVSYGDNWFRQRSADFGFIPLSEDFKRADKLLAEFWEQIGGDVEHSRARELWSTFQETIHGSEDERVRNALSADLLDVPELVASGTASATVPNRIRSIDWLKEHGTCLDNIRPGKSTNRAAGRGAFATRRIEKDQLVAPLPMVHIRRHHMEVYGGDDWDDPEAESWQDGTQLLINYCYGHPESSLLLFPYSPVVNYVNHNRTGYNAELRWSKMPQHLTGWMDRTPDDLHREVHAGIVLDMVATRPIEPGEEVFLNYGQEWENEWNKYVDDWKPSDEDKKYVSATEMNRRIPWLRTMEELKTNPYQGGDSFLTVCFVGHLPDKNETSQMSYIWNYKPGIFEDFENADSCQILRREGDDDHLKAYDRSDSVEPLNVTYTIVMTDPDHTRGVIFHGVPRRAIQFYDAHYSSDMFIRKAFRHEIHVPDELWPEAWRDLKVADR